MALIECPNCGKKISDSTDICIHCKYDLKKAKAEEKAKKSFFSIPKDLQKQYENEFCCSNKTFKKNYRFRSNYKLLATANSIGGFCLLIIIVSMRIRGITRKTLNVDFPWTSAFIVSIALLFVAEIIGFVVVLLFRRKIRRDNVIYYTEFAKWLRKNKQLELNYTFDKKEKKIYNTLYPKGDK